MEIFSKVKLFYLSVMQGSLIFKPDAVDMQMIKTPEEYGLAETSEVSVTTKDNEEIMLWVKQPEHEGGEIYVFFHGNTGHLGDVGGPTKKDEEPYDRDYRVKLLKEISENGHGFVAVSHRGFGKSTGAPSEKGFLRDIEAVADFLEKEKYDNLVIIGESLGAFSALALAEELAVKKNIVAKSVNLIAPFSSIEQKVLDDHPDLSRFDLEEWIEHELNNLEIVRRMNEKIHLNLLHSEQDNTTGIHHTRKLLKAGEERGLKIKFHDISPSSHINWSAKRVLAITSGNDGKENKAPER